MVLQHNITFNIDISNQQFMHVDKARLNTNIIGEKAENKKHFNAICCPITGN